jgi:hypothetical protein
MLDAYPICDLSGDKPSVPDKSDILVSLVSMLGYDPESLDNQPVTRDN